MRLTQLLLVLLLQVPASAGDGRLPTVLRHKYNPDFIAWIDESVAFDSEGRLRADLAADPIFATRTMQANQNGRCDAYVIEPEMEHFQPEASLEDAATSSLMAISGVVVQVSRGFFHGFPGTVIGFRVTDTLDIRPRGNPVVAERGSIRYTFIGAAEFFTPDGAICSRTRYPVTIPKPGDAVLMFSYAPANDAEDLILAVDASRHLVIERSGKRIFTPENLAESLSDVTIPEAMHRVAKIKERARSEQ
jgi:hypothetical protein